MKAWKNQKGFSMVEMIIVFAILAILTTAGLSMIGYISNANTRKVTQTLDKQLSRQQIESMSKAEDSYLYIYKADDGCCYMRLLNEEITFYDSTKFTTDGVKLCGTNVNIKMESGTQVDSSNFICIKYKKNGTFDTTKTNTKEITIDGNRDFVVNLYKDTGRHIMKEV